MSNEKHLNKPEPDFKLMELDKDTSVHTNYPNRLLDEYFADMSEEDKAKIKSLSEIPINNILDNENNNTLIKKHSDQLVNKLKKMLLHYEDNGTICSGILHYYQFLDYYYKNLLNIIPKLSKIKNKNITSIMTLLALQSVNLSSYDLHEEITISTGIETEYNNLLLKHTIQITLQYLINRHYQVISEDIDSKFDKGKISQIEYMKLKKEIEENNKTIIRQAKLITTLEKEDKPICSEYINKIGSGWEVCYKGQKKIIKDLKGINYFAICLKSPNTEFLYKTLVDAHDIDNLPIKDELSNLNKSRKIIQDELSYLKFNISDNPTEYQVEIEKLEDELKRINNKVKKISIASCNTTLNDKRISDSVTKACRNALSYINKKFPEFYEHVNNYINWRNGKISYSGEIDWD